MTVLSWILLSTITTSLLSFAGVFTLVFSEKFLRKITLSLVAFSAGAMLGGAFLHILPEAIESANGDLLFVFLWLIVGFLMFFMLEQFICWHHCHLAPSEHKHSATYLVLLADGIHNFIDGVAIAGAFLVDPGLGITVWLATVAHELPQEFGDFGILIHGGWEKKKALFYNFASGLTMILGGLLVYFFSSKINMQFLLPFAAGNFIYIASSDIIPEIKQSTDLGKNFIHFLAVLAGILLLLLIKIIFDTH